MESQQHTPDMETIHQKLLDMTAQFPDALTHQHSEREFFRFVAGIAAMIGFLFTTTAISTGLYAFGFSLATCLTIWFVCTAVACFFIANVLYRASEPDSATQEDNKEKVSL